MTDLELLGLEHGCSAEDVRRAFREKALVAHPDRGGTAEDFEALISARDRLLLVVDRVSSPRAKCVWCQGTGAKKIASGFAAIEMPCQECGGTGEAP